MTDTQAPTTTPPTTATSADEAAGDGPTEPPVAEGAAAGSGATERPAQTPPTAASAGEDEAITAATWHTGKTITRLYHAGPNNAWIALSGVGWKRLHAANDASVGAMCIIASHARDNGTTVNAYEAADGQIHQLYAW